MNKNFKYIIPNIFTALSLTSALTALHLTYEGNFFIAAWLIALSMFFDGLDGKLARLLNASSKFGALFDTLSDFVAFGVVPAILAYKISLHKYFIIGILVSLFYVFCGGYRLVRFTLSNKYVGQKKPFIGLPIPAAAGSIVSFIFLYYYIEIDFFLSHYFLILVIVSSFLMISTIEYLPIEKGKKLTKEAKFFIVLAILSIIISIKFSYLVFGIWILIYIMYGIVRQIILHSKINK